MSSALRETHLAQLKDATVTANPASFTYRFASGLTYSQLPHRVLDGVISVQHPFPFPASLDDTPDPLPSFSTPRPASPRGKTQQQFYTPKKQFPQPATFATPRWTAKKKKETPTRPQGRYALDSDSEDEDSAMLYPTGEEEEQEESVQEDVDEEWAAPVASVQGPMLFQPRPAEASEDSEDACALAILSAEPPVMMIGFDSGKVDIGVLLDSTAPRWVISSFRFATSPACIKELLLDRCPSEVPSQDAQ